MRKKLQVVGVGIVVAGVAVVAALTGSARAEVKGSEYSFAFSSARPATPAAMSVSITYRHPDDPEAKPPPLEAVALDLPPGTRLDTGATPVCTASDEEFRLLGRGACSPASEVGFGALVAVTGVPGVDPVENDLTVFNGGDELIELVSFKGTDTTAALDRLTIDGTTLTAHPPSVPGGPPDGRTTVRSIELTLERLVTTPPDCPPSRKWLSRGRFKFVAYEPEEVVAETACTRSQAGPRRARMTLAVRPRRLRVGQRTRLRVRVRSGAPACRRRVAIRLGRRVARTNARGRATLTVEFERSGRKLVRASKRGCAPARSWVGIRKL